MNFLLNLFFVILRLLVIGPKKNKGFSLSVNEKTMDVNKTSYPVFKINLSKNEIKRVSYQGKPKLVVPVIMLRETVVNGSFVKIDELQPVTWNGVPVTVEHPVNANGDFVSANSPDMLNKFAVGRIFNAHMDGDKLKAEAWICIQTANKVDPDLIPSLESDGVQMDVSTGYFSDNDAAVGEYNGVPYTNIQTNLCPDHLALLPYSEGACNFADGCGVRANNKNQENPNSIESALSSLTKLFNTNDEQMDLTTLARKFCGNISDPLFKKVVSNAIDTLNQNKEANEVTDTKPNKEDCECNSGSSLSDEDKEALEFARNFHQEQKDKYSAVLVDNGFSKEELDGFNVNQLALMASKIGVNSSDEDPENMENEDEDGDGDDAETENEGKDKPTANFSGRGVAKPNTNQDDTDKYAAMAQNTNVGALKKKEAK